MVEKNNKFYYSWKDFDLCIANIVELNKLNKVNIVVPYRGGLPFGTALSNKLDMPLSIIDFQRYDGNSFQVTMIKDTIKEEELILLVDDIADEGITLNKCISYIKENYKNNIKVHTMIGSKKHPKEWSCTFEHKGWAIFPYV